MFTVGDMEKYVKILTGINALKRNNDLNEVHSNSNRSPKWLNLLKPIWNKYYSRQHTGSSLWKTTGRAVELIILLSDPIALLDRLDLLLASHQAGNTGVRNEIVSILIR